MTMSDHPIKQELK